MNWNWTLLTETGWLHFFIMSTMSTSKKDGKLNTQILKLWVCISVNFQVSELFIICLFINLANLYTAQKFILYISEILLLSWTSNGPKVIHLLLYSCLNLIFYSMTPLVWVSCFFTDIKGHPGEVCWQIFLSIWGLAATCWQLVGSIKSNFFISRERI